MQVKQVKKKVIETEAVQFTGGLESGKSIIEWIQTKATNLRLGYSLNYTQMAGEGEEFKIAEEVRLGNGWSAPVGAWIVWNSDTGFSVISDEEFQTQFEVTAE